MALLPIHVLGDPVLRETTTPVAAVTDELRRLMDDMFETMYAARGIGIAAPQVGRRERITVVDVDDRPLALVNPEIVLAEGKAKGEEGCLSIPEVYGDVERATRVVVRALDRDGKPFEVEGTELLARCMQHEIDHLHGKLFLDYLSVLKRRSAMAKWERERAKYPSLRRTIDPVDLAKQHNEEAL
ncbi:MAG TPA: peptide deformylase [Gemmatimonadaceae bacterium]|nr:peptide deformylase [Gemmatimonadaceae bacterium]